MKNKIILALLLVATVATAQLAQINLTNRQTNVVTETVVFSIPGVVTNTGTITRTNIILGDTTAVAFGKVDTGWLWLGTVVRATNSTSGLIPYSTNSAAGYFWAPPPAGGSGGSDTNKVPIQSGGAFNLTDTNRLTLIGTNSYYTIATVTFPNGTWGDTNRDGTYYASDGSYGAGSLTNSKGEVVFVSDITSNLQSRVFSIWVTNGVGSGVYYPVSKNYAIFTNAIPSLSTNLSTNAFPVVVTGANYSGINQSYATPDTNITVLTFYYGQTDTNWYMKHAADGPGSQACWNIFKYPDVIPYYNLTNGAVNTTAPVGVWTNFQWAGTPFQGTNPCPITTGSSNIVSTNAIYRWAYYSTNAWRFFSNSNGYTISIGENITAVGQTNLFYVTNCPFVPDPAVTYYGNNTNPVIFNITNDYALAFNEPSHFFFGSIPGDAEIVFVSAGTNNTATLTNWVNSSGGSSSSGGFYSYIGGTGCGGVPDGFKFLQVGNPKTYGIYCNGGSQKIIPEVH